MQSGIRSTLDKLCKMSSSFSGTGPVTVIGSLPFAQVSGVPNSANKLTSEAPALPSNFPASLKGELAWSGSDFKSEFAYVYSLTKIDVAELEAAVAAFKGSSSSF